MVILHIYKVVKNHILITSSISSSVMERIPRHFVTVGVATVKVFHKTEKFLRVR